MKVDDRVSVREIVLEARPGSHIDNCVAAAIRLAAEEGVNVHLVHNDKHYRVNIGRIVKDIAISPTREATLTVPSIQEIKP